jgi:homoserine dehydrogenase
MKTIDLALLGFGNVGKAFARLLTTKKQELQEQFGFYTRITAIATGSHGVCLNPNGIDEQQLLNLLDSKEALELSVLDKMGFQGDKFDFIQQAPARVLVETTPVNPQTGMPALDYLRTAAKRGLHLITANKGPVVYGFHELTELTKEHGCLFRFESTVMDGAPIFSLFRGPLAGAKLHGFYGILNSCTN